LVDRRPLFVLAGNGPYNNRGCEAIVRGTVKILREHFKNPMFVSLSHFDSEKQYQEQCLGEIDEAIIHLTFHRRRPNKKEVIQNFWKPVTWKGVLHYFRDNNSKNSWGYHEMLPYLKNASAVLSIGGDNYSLDYGVPKLYTDLDDLILARRKPMMIWGASVGPFSNLPDYEKYMSDHLSSITGIFARESATIEYLKSIGVTKNVYPVADPAFLMDPSKPEGIDDIIPVKGDAIGINLSPLMAKFVTGRNLDQWTKISAAIIEKIAKSTEMSIYLIPHVTINESNDYTFMKNVLSQVQDKNKKINLMSPDYSAAELKWIISRMEIFVGSRTHSTIAALSSSVPTLSLAYSIKAQGINRDIFGNTSYCLNSTNLDAKAVADRMTSMLDRKAQIRRELDERIPEIRRSASNAGMILKQIIGDN